jgi:hypothetical protein
MRLTTIGRLLSGFAALGMMVSTAPAAVILTTSMYAENFDGTIADATTVSAHFSATAGVQNSIPGGSVGTSGWDGVKTAGTGATNMNFVVDNGSSNSGALYSYGSTISGATPFDPERALGAVASGSNIATFGVEIVNGTGATIDDLKISYTGEFWRSSTSASGTPNTLTFGYAVGASGSTTYLTAAATGLVALDLVGPTPVAANGALDGDLPANQSPHSAVLSGLNLLNGQSLYIRWADVNDQGNDAGLAVDDFKAVVVPEPASLSLLGLAGLALVGLVRRRS